MLSLVINSICLLMRVVMSNHKKSLEACPSSVYMRIMVGLERSEENDGVGHLCGDGYA